MRIEEETIKAQELKERLEKDAEAKKQEQKEQQAQLLQSQVSSVSRQSRRGTKSSERSINQSRGRQSMIVPDTHFKSQHLNLDDKPKGLDMLSVIEDRQEELTSETRNDNEVKLDIIPDNVIMQLQKNISAHPFIETQELHNHFEAVLAKGQEFDSKPRYMQTTVSNMCKDIDLNEQKIHAIKVKNNITGNKLQNKQEIDEMIQIALSTYKKDPVKTTSRSMRNKFSEYNSQSEDHVIFQSKDLFDRKYPLNGGESPTLEVDVTYGSPVTRTSQNSFQRFDTLELAIVPTLQKLTSIQEQENAENECEKGNQEISSDQNEEVKSLDQKQPIIIISEEKDVQTSMIWETEQHQLHSQVSIKQVESKEVQVEIYPSKYNYFSTTIQTQDKCHNNQVDDNQLSRTMRKKQLRANLIFDKFVSHSKKYDHEPLRFKCLQVHNQEPFIAETPIEILNQSFFTPNNLFFVYNHGSVPRLVEDEFALYVLGLVHRPVRLSIKELQTRFHKVNISVTLKCAANRKKEFDQVKFIDQKNSLNDKMSSGAVGTALWGGVRLSDILKMAQIEVDKARHVEFLGEDIVHGSEDQRYAVSLPIKQAMEKKADIILAWEMNGEPLSKDHGFPLRLICPGMVASKSVKWLSRIMIIDTESPSQHQQRDFKLMPSTVDNSNVGKVWSQYPSLSYLNIDCAFTNIENYDRVPSDRRFVIKGYAIAGNGNNIIRVEISFDNGQNWDQCKIIYFKDKKAIEMDQSYKKWEWTTWEYAVEQGLQEECYVMVRAFDECCNTQPELINMLWNFKGYMNNSIQKIKLIPLATKGLKKD